MGIFRRSRQQLDADQLASLTETARTWISTGFVEREGLVDNLPVDWDGTSARRIAVTGLDWRKPLPAG